MKRVAEWIKDHQVLAFFTLTFTITWPGFFLIFFVFPGNQTVEALYDSRPKGDQNDGT